MTSKNTIFHISNTKDCRQITVLNHNCNTGTNLSVLNTFPGYVEFIIILRPDINIVDICSIDYSINFDTFKLKTLYSNFCKERKRKHKCGCPDDVIKLETETFLEIEKKLS